MTLWICFDDEFAIEGAGFKSPERLMLALAVRRRLAFCESSLPQEQADFACIVKILMSPVVHGFVHQRARRRGPPIEVEEVVQPALVVSAYFVILDNCVEIRRGYANAPVIVDHPPAFRHERKSFVPGQVLQKMFRINVANGRVREWQPLSEVPTKPARSRITVDVRPALENIVARTKMKLAGPHRGGGQSMFRLIQEKLRYQPASQRDRTCSVKLKPSRPQVNKILLACQSTSEKCGMVRSNL